MLKERFAERKVYSFFPAIYKVILNSISCSTSTVKLMFLNRQSYKYVKEFLEVNSYL